MINPCGPPIISERDGKILHNGTPTVVRFHGARKMIRVGCTFVTFDAARELAKLLSRYESTAADVTVQE